MHKFQVGQDFEAECSVTEETRIGEIQHVQKNAQGSGSLNTPVASFFVHRPDYIEGFNPHWRVDCYVSRTDLVPKPEVLRRALVSASVVSKVAKQLVDNIPLSGGR